MFYYLSEVIDLKSFGNLAFSAIVFVYAAVHIQAEWTALKIVSLIIMYIGSVFTFIGIRIIISCTAFWIGRNVDLMNFFSWKVEQFARYPLSIFAKPFQIAFLYVIPYAFVAYVPVNALLKSPDASWWWLLTPVVGAGVFALSCLVWTLGVRSYTGTGT